PAMLEAARVRRGHRVLDVCTGHGVLAGAALERGAAVSGLDFADAVVAAAVRNVPGASFRQGDAQALPYPDASFEAVLCGYGLIHLSDPAVALGEMVRVLARGGRLAVSVWERPEPDNGFGLLYGAVREHGRLDVGLPHGPDFFQFSEPARMRAALSTAGLVDVEVASVPQAWRFDAPGDFVEAMLDGAGGAKTLLGAPEPRALAAIRHPVAPGTAPYPGAPRPRPPPPPALPRNRTNPPPPRPR